MCIACVCVYMYVHWLCIMGMRVHVCMYDIFVIIRVQDECMCGQVIAKHSIHHVLILPLALVIINFILLFVYMCS